MSPYTPVTLLHANLNKPVRILIGTIAGYHYSDATGSTHVYTTGGVFPVAQTVEAIDEIIKQLTTSKQGEDNVGDSRTTTR